MGHRRVFAMKRSKVYSLLVAKPQQKGRTVQEVEVDYEHEKFLMDDLKTKGKEKSAAYRHRLMYAKFLAIVKTYGLKEWLISGSTSLFYGRTA